MESNNNQGFIMQCKRCGHKWVKRLPDSMPRVCPKCHNPWFNVPRSEAVVEA